MTRDKLKSIEEREQEREEIIDIRDRDSGLRKFGQSNDMDFGPKGNVVKVNRDEFKDVTEKMAKQATADRFRQRFASRKTSARSKEENVEFDDHESELDALIGNMDIKGAQLQKRVVFQIQLPLSVLFGESMLQEASQRAYFFLTYPIHRETTRTACNGTS